MCNKDFKRCVGRELVAGEAAMGLGNGVAKCPWGTLGRGRPDPKQTFATISDSDKHRVFVRRERV